ncbi:MAG: type IV pilin-like G/H family protein [Cyanobacteria bacterium P01_E01_bin.42]
MSDRTNRENKNSSRSRQTKVGLRSGNIALFLYGCTAICFYYYFLPRLLSSASKAKESEARTYIRMAVRTPKEYIWETNSFSRRLESWGTGLKSETDNYAYRILFPSVPTTTEIVETEKLNAIAIAAYPKVRKPKYTAPKKVFLGIVWTFGYDSSIRSSVCESEGSFEALKAEGENEFEFLHFSYPSSENRVGFSCPEGFKNLDSYFR